MAGAPAFDPSKPFEDLSGGSAPAFDPSKPFDVIDAPADQEPADHGLSERQKLSSIGKALSPITSYPETYSRMNRESRELASQGLEQLAHPNGFMDVAKGAGKAALGTLGYVSSPINAAYRSIVGQPVEDVTGVPREYTEFAAQLATPGIGLPKIGGAAPAVTTANTARSAAPATNDVVAAADRISQVAPSPINVPRAFASDNIAVQRAGQMARNVPIVGDSIPRATGEMVDQMGNAVGSIASHYGQGSGPNVANRIGRTIGEAADAETTAATNAARQSDDSLLAAWQRDQDASNAAIAGHETSALERARQAVGDMSPQDMGQALIQRLRAGEQEARATKDRLYGVAGDSDASIHAGEVRNVHARVAQGLEDAGVEIDPGSAAAPSITPAANRMMNVLQELSNLKIGNKAVGSAGPASGSENIAAVSAQGLEQARKKLVFLRSAATNDADRRAATQVMRQFEDWQSHAFENALFSGSDEALSAFRQARAANASWRQRFFNNDDDAGKFIERIVTGEVTPQEAANYIVGAGKVGAKGVSSRLLTRIAEATGGDPEATQAIRGGIWNRLTQAAEGVAEKTGAKVADDIGEFLNGSGRDVAQRLFTPEQQNLMRAYADTLRRGAEAREMVTAAAKNTKPTPMAVGPGPMQELANAVLGRGGKTDEALFAAIDAYARSGARGDVKTLADIMKAIPEKDRGDLAGAIIRKLGQSKASGEFSPDIFATEWNKYSPQGKTVLLGNAGAHRQALDDVALISQRYKEVGRRFGNPSGTAQNVTGLGALAGIFTHPYVAIPALVGGTVFAKLLSAPVGAQRAATWGKTVTAMSRGVTPARLSAFETASKSLAAASNKLGANITTADLMRAIQGPVPTRAQDEQPKS